MYQCPKCAMYYTKLVNPCTIPKYLVKTLFVFKTYYTQKVKDGEDICNIMDY